jgi:hypothetical protein
MKIIGVYPQLEFKHSGGKIDKELKEYIAILKLILAQSHEWMSEVQLHSFLSSARHEDIWYDSGLGRCIPGQRT